MFTWATKLRGCASTNWFALRASAGKVTLIRVPWFNLLLTLIDPSMSSTRRFDIFKPKPVPLIWRAFSIRSKGVKSRFWSSSLIPMPWSMTLNITLPLLYFTCAFTDLPWLVNLIAFDSKLSATWPNLVSSKNNESGTASSILVLNTIPLSSARILVSENKWVKKSLVFTARGITRIFPASICFISKTEFTISKSLSPLWLTWESGVVNDEGKFNFWASPSSNWLNVFMALSGVLISWLT